MFKGCFDNICKSKIAFFDVIWKDLKQTSLFLPTTYAAWSGDHCCSRYRDSVF